MNNKKTASTVRNSIISLNKGKVKTILKLTLAIFALTAWVAISFIASQYIILFILEHIFNLTSTHFEQPFWLAIYEFLNYALMITLTILVPAKILKKIKFTKTNRQELGLENLPTWIDIGLAPVGFIAYTILAAAIVAVFSTIFPWFDASEIQDTGFNNFANNLDKVIAFFALVVIAPIAEEIIFRGWLYGKLRQIIPQKISIPLSMLIVSILFGLVHLQWNVGVNVFCLSLILCAMREVTGTIYSGIFLHMLKNGIAFYLLYVIM